MKLDFTQEEQILLENGLQLAIASSKRAQKNAQPEFAALHKRFEQAQTALLHKVSQAK